MCMVCDFNNSTGSSGKNLPGILAIVALCGLLTLFLPGLSQAQEIDPAGGIVLSIGDYSSFPGSTIVLPIQVDRGAGIAFGEFTLSYDAASLILVSVGTTELTTGFTLVDTVKSPGKLGVSLINTTAISGGSGDLVEVVFEVNTSAPVGQVSELVLENAAFFDELGQPFDIEVDSGEFTVGTLRPLALALADIASIPGSTISTFLSVDEATGIAFGEFTLAYDAASLTPVGVGATELTAGFVLVDTVKSPGKLGISLVNATAIAGGSGDLVEVVFEVNTGAPVGQVSELVLENVAFFDELGQPFGAVIDNGAFLAESSIIISLALADAASIPGSTLVVPIAAAAEESMGIAGGELVLVYDPDILTPTQVQAAELSLDFIVDFAVNSSGRLAIVLAGSMGQEVESGDLVHVEFEVNPDAAPGSTSELRLDTASLYDESTFSLGVETGDGVFTVLNRGPEATEDEFTVEEDLPTGLAVLENDEDLDGDELILSGVTQPEHGAVEIDPQGQMVNYVPELNYHGSDSFTYTVSDGEATASQAVSVTVTPVNDAPDGFDLLGPADDSRLGRETVAFSWDAANDVDGDAITYELIVSAGGGEVSFSTGETSLDVDLLAAGFSSQELAGTWSVSATDGEFSVAATGDRTFTLEELAPKMVVDAASLTFGEVVIGARESRTLNIGNQGNAELTVSGIAATDGQFAVGSSSVGVPPGESRDVEVTFAPVLPGAQSGELVIASDDAGQPEVRISLAGSGAGIEVWAGDTNGDGTVDGRDVLPIGMFWEVAGATRPLSGTTWEARGVASWAEGLAALADADGNGVVNAADILPVAENWRQSRGASKVAGGGEIYAEPLGLGILQAMEQALEMAPASTGRGELMAFLRRSMEIHMLPRQFTLLQNAPNPFNPTTTIRYAIPSGVEGGMRLRIFDVTGQLVRTLIDNPAVPGQHQAIWDGRDEGGRSVASGMYIYRMEGRGFAAARRMLLVR